MNYAQRRAAMRRALLDSQRRGPPVTRREVVEDVLGTLALAALAWLALQIT